MRFPCSLFNELHATAVAWKCHRSDVITPPRWRESVTAVAGAFLHSCYIMSIEDKCMFQVSVLPFFGNNIAVYPKDYVILNECEGSRAGTLLGHFARFFALLRMTPLRWKRYWGKLLYYFLFFASLRMNNMTKKEGVPIDTPSYVKLSKEYDYFLITRFLPSTI